MCYIVSQLLSVSVLNSALHVWLLGRVLTCLPPQGVKVIDLSPLHFLFIFLGQVQQVGHDLTGNKIQHDTD